MSLGRQKKSGESIEVIRKLRAKFPDDVDLMVFLGGQLEDAKKYEEAVGILTEASAKDPKNASAQFSLGVVHDKMGNFEKMVASMEKAIEIDPKHAAALNYLGYTYADRNMKLSEAESLILRALEVRPNDGYFTDSLAWVHYRQGDLKRAESELRQALTLVPDDPVVLEHLGDVLMSAGKAGEAVSFFEKAIAKGHEKPDEIRSKLSRTGKESLPSK
jgi:Flp pilus assembly protein TadD